MPTDPCRAHRAFTLVELLAVLSLVALIAAIGTRTMAMRLDDLAVRGAIAEAASAIARARDEALAQRTIVTLRIDTARGLLSLRVRERPAVVYQLRHDRGVTLSSTRDSVSFDARGLGYGAANFTLVARRARAADTLVVSRLGRVRF